MWLEVGFGGGEEAFDFAAQFGVTGTGGVQKSRPFGGRKFIGLIEQVLNAGPLCRTHGVGGEASSRSSQALARRSSQLALN